MDVVGREGGGGAFEVSLNGEEVHSKLKKGRFPDNDEVVKALKKRLG